MSPVCRAPAVSRVVWHSCSRAWPSRRQAGAHCGPCGLYFAAQYVVLPWQHTRTRARTRTHAHYYTRALAGDAGVAFEDGRNLIVSRRANDALSRGAIFYIYDGDEPLMVGFFVSPWVALTVFHDNLFTDPVDHGAPFPVIRARTSALPAVEVEFDVFAYSPEPLDFVVLVLRGPTASPAYFPLPRPEMPIFGGWAAGLVTMGLGAFTETRDVEELGVDQHRVTINSRTSTHLKFSGTATWGGDSGSALIVFGEQVLGLHQEVVRAGADVRALVTAAVAPSVPRSRSLVYVGDDRGLIRGDAVRAEAARLSSSGGGASVALFLPASSGDSAAAACSSAGIAAHRSRGASAALAPPDDGDGGGSATVAVATSFRGGSTQRRRSDGSAAPLASVAASGGSASAAAAPSRSGTKRRRSGGGCGGGASAALASPSAEELDATLRADIDVVLQELREDAATSITKSSERRGYSHRALLLTVSEVQTAVARAIAANAQR